MLLAPGWEHDVVIRSGDRARGAEEDVGLAGGDAVVHDARTERERLLGRERPALRLLGDDQVDHVPAVVGAALEDLAWMEGCKRGQLGQRDVPAALSQAIDHLPRCRPALQDLVGVAPAVTGEIHHSVAFEHQTRERWFFVASEGPERIHQIGSAVTITLFIVRATGSATGGGVCSISQRAICSEISTTVLTRL